jgi:hypothetical protein
MLFGSALPKIAHVAASTTHGVWIPEIQLRCSLAATDHGIRVVSSCAAVRCQGIVAGPHAGGRLIRQQRRSVRLPSPHRHHSEHRQLVRLRAGVQSQSSDKADGTDGSGGDVQKRSKCSIPRKLSAVYPDRRPWPLHRTPHERQARQGCFLTRNGYMPTQAVAPCSGDMRRSHMSRPSCVLSRHCSFALRSSRCSTSRHCAAQHTQPQHLMLTPGTCALLWVVRHIGNPGEAHWQPQPLCR